MHLKNIADQNEDLNNNSGILEAKGIAVEDIVAENIKNKITITDNKRIFWITREETYKVNNDYIIKLLSKTKAFNDKEKKFINSLLTTGSSQTEFSKNIYNYILSKITNKIDSDDFEKDTQKIEMEVESEYFDIKRLNKYLSQKGYTAPITEIIKSYALDIPILMQESVIGSNYIARFNGDLNIFNFLKEEIKWKVAKIEQDPDNVFRLTLSTGEILPLFKCTDYRPIINQKDFNFVIERVSGSLITEQLYQLFGDNEVDQKKLEDFCNSKEFVEYSKNELERKIIITDSYIDDEKISNIMQDDIFTKRLCELNLLKETECLEYLEYIDNHKSKIEYFHKLFIKEKEIIMPLILEENSIDLMLNKSGNTTFLWLDGKKYNLFKLTEDIGNERTELLKALAIIQNDFPEWLLKQLKALPEPMNYYNAEKNIPMEMLLDILQFIVNDKNIIGPQELNSIAATIIGRIIKAEQKIYKTIAPLIKRINNIANNDLLKMKMSILLVSIHDPHTLIEHSVPMAYCLSDFFQYLEQNKNSKKSVDALTFWSALKGKKELLLLGFLFHDIGKLIIAQVLLKKKGSISVKKLLNNGIIGEEKNIIDKHVTLGVSIYRKLFSRNINKIVLNCIKNHHLPEDHTPKLYERIINLFDIFNAMIEERAYKNSVPLAEVLMANKEFLDKYPVVKKYLLSRP